MFQPCSACSKARESQTSDIELIVEMEDDDKKFLVNKLTLHYISDHGYAPDAEFINAITTGEIASNIQLRTNGSEFPETYTVWYKERGYELIGYLDGVYESHSVPQSFLRRLNQLFKDTETWDGQE